MNCPLAIRPDDESTVVELKYVMPPEVVVPDAVAGNTNGLLQGVPVLLMTPAVLVMQPVDSPEIVTVPVNVGDANGFVNTHADPL